MAPNVLLMVYPTKQRLRMLLYVIAGLYMLGLLRVTLGQNISMYGLFFFLKFDFEPCKKRTSLIGKLRLIYRDSDIKPTEYNSKPTEYREGEKRQSM